MNNMKADSESLFSDLETTAEKIIDFSKKKIFFVTNEENLKEIIISGQIRNREAYNQYYRDCLELCPGFIPFFIDYIPNTILTQCQEDNSVAVVILELKLTLNELKDYIKAFIDKDGKRKEEKFGFNEEVLAIFIDSVLSVNNVSKVYFKESKQLANFKLLKNTLPNLDIDSLKYSSKLKKSIFVNNHKITNESLKFDNNELQPGAKEKYMVADAKTGCLAYLICSLPKLNEPELLLNAISNEKNLEEELEIFPKGLEILPYWFNNSNIMDDEIEKKLLLATLKWLANLEASKGLSSSFLQELEASLNVDGEVGRRVSDRFLQIKNILTSDGSDEDFFLDNTMKSLGFRGLCLLMMYHSSLNDPNLNEETQQRLNLSRVDLLFRDIFYATWKGWRKFEKRPKDSKTIAALNDFQEYLVNGFYIGEEKPFKFSPYGDIGEWAKDVLLKQKWMKKERDFAILIAKNHDLPCLEYEIKAPKENLTKLSLENSFLAKFSGAIELKEKIDEDEFKKLLLDITLSESEKKEFGKTK